MKAKEIKFTGANGVSLPGIIWYPLCSPTMVVQITHGMTEHIGRYEQLAEYLTSYGIAVAGFDLRGHGHNPGDNQCASFGEKVKLLAPQETVNKFGEYLKGLVGSYDYT